MGSFMGCSFEFMVIDNEVIGMIVRLLCGIEVLDDIFFVDIIYLSVIDFGYFLGNS